MSKFIWPSGSLCSLNRQRIHCRLIGRCLAVLVVLTQPNASASGDPGRQVEIGDGESTWTGSIVARNQASCFLLDGFGELHELSIPKLKSFRVIAPRFSPATDSEFRERLLTDFPGDYEVAKFGHYVVCAGRGRARDYASLFDQTYRQITHFYRLRGFEIRDPATPLVGVVVLSGQEFRRCCEADGMEWTSTLHGYYSLRTNRVVLFDSPPEPAAVAQPERTGAIRKTSSRPEEPATPPDDDSSAGQRIGRSAWPAQGHFAIPAHTSSTIIHETTHQVSFNVGIHSRTGSTPLWLVEGLATVLEAPGMRSRAPSTDPDSEINHDRLEWYATQYEPRQQPGDLQQLIASEEPFRLRTLDAYSQSWALVWYLTENPVRARKFAVYLKTLAARDPFDDYSPDERLADFQAHFGDLARTEVQLRRRIDDVINAP
jgi:hypothetical protein